ncbi:MAG: hypothetical protein WCI18_17265 [Pseudomonadota bacterium]
MKLEFFMIGIFTLIAVGCKSDTVNSNTASSPIEAGISQEVRNDFETWEKEIFPSTEKLVKSVSQSILKRSASKFNASKDAGPTPKADTSRFNDPFVKKVVQAKEDGMHLSWQAQISSIMVEAIVCENRYSKKAEVNLHEKPIDRNNSRFESASVNEKVETLRGITDGITAMTQENQKVLEELDTGTCWNFTTMKEDNCKLPDPTSCKNFIPNI